MKRVVRLGLALALALPCWAQWKSEGTLEAPPGPIPNLYRGDAKKEIQKGLARAEKNGHRVLLVFGGDWCYDCHVLEYNFRQDAGLRALLRANYEVVHVDVGRFERNLDLPKKYQIDINKGVPAMAVLDAKGNLLYHDPGGFFEHARGMTKQAVAEFLQAWAPPRKN